MKLSELLTLIFLVTCGAVPAAYASQSTGRTILASAQHLRRGWNRKLLLVPASPDDVFMVQGLFDAWNAALATLDAAKVAALYAPGALLLPTLSNTPRDTPELIEDYFVHFLEKKPKGTINKSYVFRLSTTLAMNSGTYTFELTDPKDGYVSQVQGRFTFIYELINGTWMIVEHHSSAMPEQPLPTHEQIEALFTVWNAALATLDPKKVAALYTKDAVLLPTVSNQVRDTPEGIEDYFVHFLEKHPKGQIDSSEVAILSPTLASNAGTYTFFITVDGVPDKVQARYSFLYRKEGGKWLIAQHHSSAMPEQQLPTQKEIHALFDLWNAALQTKDAAKVVELYATGSILLPTMANYVADAREEKLAYFQTFLKKKPVGRINEEHIQILSPNLAANSGLYTFTLTQNGKSSSVKARYTFVYSKIGGQWKIVDHHSSSLPVM